MATVISLGGLKFTEGAGTPKYTIFCISYSREDQKILSKLQNISIFSAKSHLQADSCTKQKILLHVIPLHIMVSWYSIHVFNLNVL